MSIFEMSKLDSQSFEKIFEVPGESCFDAEDVAEIIPFIDVLFAKKASTFQWTICR